MSSLFWASYVLLWAVCMLLLVAVVVLARLVGTLSARVPGRGALLTANGPEHGDEVPRLLQADGFPPAEHRWTMVAFLSPRCEDCRALPPALRAIAREESGWLGLAVAPAGPEPVGFEDYVRASFGPHVAVLRDPDLAPALQVHATPFVLVVDPQGVLRAKGVANRREQLDGLLQAAREPVEPLATAPARTGLPTAGKEAS